jgi:FeS assembly SUF system protein
METKPQRVPLEVENSVPQPLPPRSPVVPDVGTNPPNPLETTTGPVDVGEIEEKIIAALRTCYDPEIPVNIYEMGLIYDLDVNPAGDVVLRMTLTSPACPVAGSLPPEVQAKVAAVPGVKSAKVDVVWEPPWTPDRMSEAAQLQLGMF